MRAERETVERRAQRREEDGVEPRAPGAGAQPEQEQPREHHPRERQLEQDAPRGAAARAGCAQRVEHQPEREAHGQRQRRVHRLIPNRGAHPNSLAQKPSALLAASV